jgi:flagellar biosynthesis chaperone FliJ
VIRFKWRLQRVLDITGKREQALRAELWLVAREITLVREEILARQTLIRTLLEDLGRRSLADRLPEQTVVMASAAAEQRLLTGLRTREANLVATRNALTDKYMRTRGTRQTLERLREEARVRYLRAAGRIEQAQFDEFSHMAHDRRERPHAVHA